MGRRLPGRVEAVAAWLIPRAAARARDRVWRSPAALDSYSHPPGMGPAVTHRRLYRPSVTLPVTVPRGGSSHSALPRGLR